MIYGLVLKSKLKNVNMFTIKFILYKKTAVCWCFTSLMPMPWCALTNGSPQGLVITLWDITSEGFLKGNRII